jgi:hypothetical protein
MADARGEYWYFDDGVDANKITVPELRSILLRHGVTYPSSAKKPVLVGLFNDVVLPQKSKAQRAQAHTKRSTRGIVDVPSSSTSTNETDETNTEDDTRNAGGDRCACTAREDAFPRCARQTQQGSRA